MTHDQMTEEQKFRKDYLDAMFIRLEEGGDILHILKERFGWKVEHVNKDTGK